MLIIRVVNPEVRRVYAHHLGTHSEILVADAELTGALVLPGLYITVSDIFLPLEHPSALSALGALNPPSGE
ncbi:MAG: hypothetical protein RMI91_07545 [Gemmatales bacterium]|nr:hypothetical protein [Gemmatales bacterium]MDW7994494.1 hypothetical protein [Gemmatales bacterium]